MDEQKARLAFIGARSYHFQTMIHGNGDDVIPFSILRMYWNIATDRATAYVNRGAWKKPTTMQVWYDPRREAFKKES